MRNALLRRLTTGFIAAATVVSMFAGLSLTTSAAAPAYPLNINSGADTLQVTDIKIDGTAATSTDAAVGYTDASKGIIGISYTAANFKSGDTITLKTKYTPAAGKYLTSLKATQVTASSDDNPLGAAEKFTLTGGTNVALTTVSSGKYSLGLTLDATELTFTLTAKNDLTADGIVYVLIEETDTNVFAIPYGALAKDDALSLAVDWAIPSGSYLTSLAATEVADANGTTLTNTKFTTTNYAATSLKQMTVSDMITDSTTSPITFKASAAIPAGANTLYVKIAPPTTATMSNYAFWSSVAGRRQIAASDVNETDKVITIYYDRSTDLSLWSIKGDALPTITIGKVIAGKNIFTANQSTDYYTATNAKDGDKVKLNGVEYKVTYKIIDSIPLINSTTLLSANDKKKTAYTMTLSIGGADYTLNKDTDYTSIISGTDTAPVVTFKNVTSLTGSGTITFKGTYLYADQSFTVTTAALTSDAGAIVSLVYRDGTTQTVVVKADAAAVTASSVAYFTCTEQGGTDAIGDNKKRVTLLIGGTKNTAYPRALSLNAGLDTLTINLVNDTLPANMQVKLECKYIAGGTKTMDIKYYDQVFPVELTDGSYAFFSVVVKCIKNDILPVTSFDLMGYSTNLNLIPLSTWDQTTTALNKIIYFDLTGVLTDKTINSGVLADGTTDKLYPSTSFAECNPSYKDARDFSITWKINGTLGGTVVKYTRPTITFDVTDPTTNLPISYTAVLITSKAAINVVATNTTLGGQVAVATTAGDYNQTWKQADAYSQFVRDKATSTKGTIDLTAYYYGPKSLDTDYVTMAIRLPRGCTLTIDGKASGEAIPSGSIKMFTLLQNWTGTVGNTTTDGCIDYILKLQYREFNESGSATGAANTLKIAYPLKNKDGKSASATSFKEYTMTTTWVKKAYSGEKKVTMAGVTVPDAIVAPSSSASSSSVPATTSTTTSTTSTSSASLPTNPPMGVPFNALAYVVTIAASAIGGVSTMIIRKK